MIQITEHEWLKISEIGRLRAENRLIQSIREGQYSFDRKACLKGGLGTWAVNIASGFILEQELVNAIIWKLRADNPDERAYALEYFIVTLLSLRPKPPSYLVSTLKRLLSEHDEAAHSALAFLGFEDEDSEWAKQLGEAYKSFEPPPSIANDDIPF